jgi:hypothetical protein
MDNGHIERTFALSPGTAPTIAARTPSGTIQIRGEQRDDVAVSITVNPADAIGRDLEIILEEQGSTIRAEVRGPGRGDSLFGWLRGNLRIAIDIRTPMRSTIEADGASASVAVEGIEGEVRIRTASGDVRSDRLGPAVSVQTASGDVRAHALNGNVRIQSASGDVTLERGEGEIIVQTASGDIELDQISGTLEVTSASGDCTVRSSAVTVCKAKTASGDLNVTTPLATNGEYEFSTVSGDLALLVPQETRMTINMKTVSGDLSCALPAVTTDGGKRNRTLQVNGGGVPVRVKSVSGDCTVRAANSNLPPLPSMGSQIASQVTDAVTRAMAGAFAPPAPPTPPTPPSPPSFAPPSFAPPTEVTHGAGNPTEEGATEDSFSETLSVLQAVERGELTIEEAMEKLAALEESPNAPITPPAHGGTQA